jgi:hypothetical protein
MEKYEKVEIEVIEFDEEDVITTSREISTPPFP